MMTSALKYFHEAELLYHLHEVTQKKIDDYEEEALRLTAGDKKAAADNYLIRTDTEAGWRYNNLVATRNMYLTRAVAAATMALASKTVHEQ